MKKKILVYMEVDTDDTDAFIEHDIKQELSCCSCFYENIVVKIFNLKGDKNQNDIT